jgi:hypothetical protein
VIAPTMQHRAPNCRQSSAQHSPEFCLVIAHTKRYDKTDAKSHLEIHHEKDSFARTASFLGNLGPGPNSGARQHSSEPDPSNRRARS